MQCTGFSNSEERAVGKDKAVPFLLEDRMKELGGAYTAGPDWQPHAGGHVASPREGARERDGGGRAGGGTGAPGRAREFSKSAVFDV